MKILIQTRPAILRPSSLYGFAAARFLPTDPPRTRALLLHRDDFPETAIVCHPRCRHAARVIRLGSFLNHCTSGGTAVGHHLLALIRGRNTRLPKRYARPVPLKDWRCHPPVLLFTSVQAAPDAGCQPAPARAAAHRF